MRTTSLTALCVLVWAAAAAAQDSCLTGAAQLGDQRALKDVRQATDANCPCESFVGAGARRAFRRCANDVLKGAVQASQIRSQCRRTAKAVSRGASCGSDRTPCGRVRNNGRVTCRLARTSGAGACGSRPARVENECADETYCSDVVGWTAATCTDPRRAGPYATGVRTIQMVKPSVVDPQVDRVLDTIVWYPAPTGAGPVNVPLGGVVDAAVDTSGGPYPVLLFSHGSCGFPTQARFLTALLASQGFIVIAPPHPGNTLSEFPNCGTVAAQVASVQERPQDVIFALDFMLDLGAQPASEFFAALDADKVGMSGHSFGGLTTYLVAAIEPRIKVALPFAPAVPGNPSLAMPSLTMLGQIDSVVNNAAIRDAFQQSASPPKYLVEIEKAGHYAWSEVCFPSSDCAPPATLTQAEAHDAVRRWVLPFLRRHLDGDESFASFFAGTVPGIVLLADP